MLFNEIDVVPGNRFGQWGTGLIGGVTITLLIALLIAWEAGRRGEGLRMKALSSVVGIPLLPLVVCAVFVFIIGFQQL